MQIALKVNLKRSNIIMSKKLTGLFENLLSYEKIFLKNIFKKRGGAPYSP